MPETCLECGQDRRAHSAPDGGGCPGDFASDLAIVLAELRRLVQRERALWTSYKSAAFAEVARRSWEAAFDDMASAFDSHAERILAAAEAGILLEIGSAADPVHSPAIGGDHTMCGYPFTPTVKRTLRDRLVTCPRGRELIEISRCFSRQERKEAGNGQ